MNLFNFNKKMSSEEEKGLTGRLEIFLDKLTGRARDLFEEVKANAQTIADEDQDSFKRDYHQFKAAIIAQFNSIMQKGVNTYQTKVLPEASSSQAITLAGIYNSWHSNILQLMISVFEDVKERDLEKEYAMAMEAYNRNRNNYVCKQCGGKLEIDQFYFLATYIKCSYCQTQNTFDPGSSVKMVEHLARPLAELRCSHLKTQHKAIRQEQGLVAGFESYQQYAKAVIEQMDQILPGLEAQHMNFYNRMISDYRAYGAPW